MGYSPEAYEKAELVLSNFRRLTPAKLAERTEEIYKKLPEIKEIDEKIINLGIKLTKAAMSADSERDTDAENLLVSLEGKKKSLLTQNGYAEDYLSNASNCPLCRDSGYVGGAMCKCLKKMLSEFDFSASVEAPEYSFERFRTDIYSDEIIPKYKLSPRTQMKNVFDYCKRYTETFSKNSDNILMYGGAGLGKTYICNCIAKELSKRGFNVILSSAYNIFEIISKNKFNYKTDFTSDINRYYDCDLLIMDDLGTEFVTEYSVSALFDIINYRLTHHKPIIINANLSLQDMSSRYSDRIVSRLLTFRHLLFLGNDIRAMNL